MLRSGRLSLGPTIDRFEEAFAAGRRRAVRGGRLERNGWPAPALRHSRGEPRRRGRSPRRTRSSRPRTARSTRARRPSSRTSTRARSTSRRRRSRRRSRTGRALSWPSTSTATRASSTSCARSATRTAIALIQDACEALGARYKGALLGSQGPSGGVRVLPEQADDDGRGRDGDDALGAGVASAPQPAQPGSSGLGRLARARAARASTTASTTSVPRSGSASSRSSTTILEARARVASRYGELLASIPGLELPCADDAEHERSWFVYVVTLPARRRSRGRDRRRSHERGVQTARYLPCIHLQPYMQERFGYRVGLCPVAEGVASRTLALPFHARLDEDDQAYVAEALRARARDRPAARERRSRSGRAARSSPRPCSSRTAGSTRRRRTTCRTKGSPAGSAEHSRSSTSRSRSSRSRSF